MIDKTVDLWAAVRKAQELLRDHENYPVLDSFETAWKLLDEYYATPTFPSRKDEKEFIERTRAKRDDVFKASSTPLSSLMFYTEMGHYPPPELLLGLLDSWETYLQGRGTVSLEEAFLGRPKRRSGTFAKRQVVGK